MNVLNTTNCADPDETQRFVASELRLRYLLPVWNYLHTCINHIKIAYIEFKESYAPAKRLGIVWGSRICLFSATGKFRWCSCKKLRVNNPVHTVLKRYYAQILWSASYQARRQASASTSLWASMQEILTLLLTNKKGTDQPAHLGSLISVNVIRYLKSTVTICTSDIPSFFILFDGF